MGEFAAKYHIENVAFWAILGTILTWIGLIVLLYSEVRPPATFIMIVLSITLPLCLHLLLLFLHVRDHNSPACSPIVFCIQGAPPSNALTPLLHRCRSRL